MARAKRSTSKGPLDLLRSPITNRIVQVGDEVRAYGDSRSAAITGTVIKLGRVNAQVQSVYQARPDGPWFEPIFKVPYSAINVIARNGIIIFDVRSKCQSSTRI